MARAPARKTPPKPAPKQPDRSAWLEWIIAGASSLVVIALVGFLVYDAIRQNGGTPILMLAVESTNVGQEGQVVVTVGNDGDRAAAEVRIEGLAGEERSEAALDFSPAHSRLSVTLMFSEPVDAGDVALRVLSFTDP